MKFKIYTDKSGKQRWKLVAKNGQIVADGSEGYNGVGNARRAIKTFKEQIATSTVELVVPGEEASDKDGG